MDVAQIAMRKHLSDVAVVLGALRAAHVDSQDFAHNAFSLYPYQRSLHHIPTVLLKVSHHL